MITSDRWESDKIRHASDEQAEVQTAPRALPPVFSQKTKLRIVVKITLSFRRTRDRLNKYKQIQTNTNVRGYIGKLQKTGYHRTIPVYFKCLGSNA